MSEHVIDVTGGLRLAHAGLRAADAAVVASAESLLSYLILHLRHRKAPLPAALASHVERLEDHARRL